MTTESCADKEKAIIRHRRPPSGRSAVKGTSQAGYHLRKLGANSK